MYKRSEVIKWAKMCIGIKENTPEHRNIIDCYNAWAKRFNLPKMYYDSPWCACFVSNCFMCAQYTKLFPCGISCGDIRRRAMAMNIWQGDSNYNARMGDVIMYDWDKNHTPDHVGLILTSNNAYYEVIEGNYQDSVKMRKIAKNSPNIIGYILPRYDD